MKRITDCRACRSKNIKTFLDLGKQPFANSLRKSLNEKEDFYPLSLSWCRDCNLIQLNHTAEPADLFSSYVWVTSTSSTAKAYSKVFCRQTLCRIKSMDVNYVLEVASNDGTFLRPFIHANHKVLGVDPAKNVADMAIRSGIPTQCKFFGVKAAQEIVKELGRAKVVIARNVLAHVADLRDFVKGLRLCLARDGLLVLEVHYAKKIYEDLQYDSIYHEHLCYFTLKSAESLLSQFRLFVVDVGLSPISGGALILYVKRSKVKEHPIVKKYRRIEEKKLLNNFITWENFARRVILHKQKLLKILKKITDKGYLIVGYGASARSSTMLNFCGLTTREISAIIDNNSFKQNRWTAGSNIPIVSRNKGFALKPDILFILAWNFRDEIIHECRAVGYTGSYLIPLPIQPHIIKD